MLQIIKGLLSIVSLLMKWADEATQRKLGEDLYVKQQLADMSVRIGMAKKIDIHSDEYTDADIGVILRGYYRKE